MIRNKMFSSLSINRLISNPYTSHRNVFYFVPKDPVNGVFAQFEQNTSGKVQGKLRGIEGWKGKILQWIRDQEIDGKKLKETANKELNKTMRIAFEPDEKAAKKWNGPCNKMLNICKKMPVHKVLEAAKVQKSIYPEVEVCSSICPRSSMLNDI